MKDAKASGETMTRDQAAAKLVSMLAGDMSLHRSMSRSSAKDAAIGALTDRAVDLILEIDALRSRVSSLEDATRYGEKVCAELVAERDAARAREREAVTALAEARERAESLAKNQAHIQERIQAALGNGADEQAWEPGEHWLIAACRVISAHTVKPLPEPPTPLFTLTIPNDLVGRQERFNFTAEALARMAAMEKEGKIQGRIAQDNLGLRSALAAARKALEVNRAAVRDACHAVAIYGDQPPQMYLDALTLANAVLNGDSHAD